MKIVVFVPGIMGSGLRNDDGAVWPPSAAEVIFGYKRIADLMGVGLRVTDIIRRVSLVSVYKTILEDITKCGYSDHGAERRFIPFPYDWRQSNRKTAEMLAARLDQDLGDDADDLSITLIAHSMGGLVCRYLLESGHFAQRPWFDRVAHLITLGTPHRGAPLALKRLAGEEGALGVSGDDIKSLGNDSRYPSLCELVGFAGNGFAIQQQPRGALPIVIDPLNDEIAQNLGLSADNIGAARAFWQSLDIARRPAHVGYFCVAGSALKTVVRSEVRSPTHAPLSIERKDAGDGTVPFLSAAIAGTAQVYSCKKHATIFEDRDVRETLYRILDAPAHARPQAADDTIDVGQSGALGISVNQESYAPGEAIEVSVSYNEPVANPQEIFEILQFDPATESRTAVPLESIRTSFTGTELNGFRFTIENTLGPGLYRIRPLRDVDDPTPTFFFIREASND